MYYRCTYVHVRTRRTYECVRTIDACYGCMEMKIVS